MFDRLTFVLGEALVSIRRNLGMVILGALTVAVCIYIAGGLTLTYLSVWRFGQNLSSRFEIKVFLKDGTTKQQISDTAKQIRLMDGVDEVNWIPRDLAWEKMKREDPANTVGLDNVLQDAYKVKIKDLSKSDAIAAKIQALPQVEPGGVHYLQVIQKQVEEALRFLKWVGLVAGGLLALVSGVLIFTVVRLTAIARRVEIRIMSLVGASYVTVYMPLLLEGAFQGLVGGAIAYGLISLSHHELANVIRGYTFVTNLPPLDVKPILLSCIGAGTGYGLLCSILALLNLQKKIR